MSTLLPMWFRGLLIAIATVIMCSCSAPAQSQEIQPQQCCPEHQAPSGCDACRDGTCVPQGGCQACGIPGPCDEYLCDGGDYYSPVGVRSNWKIDGLEQEDTVAHYDTLGGCVLVEPSNRVCIYAPRFGAVRRVVTLVEKQQRNFVGVVEEDASLALAAENEKATTTLQNLQPVARIGDLPPSLLKERQQAGEMEARVVVRELTNMIKPYCDFQVVRLGVMDNAEKPWLAKNALAAYTWTGDQEVQVVIEKKATSVLASSLQPGVVFNIPGGKPCLRLIKLASARDALPGEEIEFTLRFDNIGTEEIGNVTIVDNLATRLEYVPESAESSIDADFSTEENSGGSLILRWEIKEPLEPKQGGVLQFKVRVR
ncbi:hypothetical protein KOR34_36680 [Posidoniimonas corsicana]|uniref:DUF11 domain-containing protein n=1 Tax=Posidoniimonas corsicana TaxID=1938618 RepID=A0A5C5V5K6_9BACT|nr:DUF11 domain-containing protein [Posidoniimonas corsicana]TWT33834.1 hypothetical protein KOR34_36680 [Posidoniimonas corsicana]